MSDQKMYYKNWPEGVPKEVNIPTKNLVDFLEDSVKLYPDNVVTYFMGFELTYSMLLDIVYRVATKLTELGIKKGSNEESYCKENILDYYDIPVDEDDDSWYINLGKTGRKETVVNLSAQLNLTGFLMLLPVYL